MTTTEQLDSRLAELGIPPHVMTPERFKAVAQDGYRMVVKDLEGHDGKKYISLYFVSPDGNWGELL